MFKEIFLSATYVYIYLEFNYGNSRLSHVDKILSISYFIVWYLRNKLPNRIHRNIFTISRRTFFKYPTCILTYSFGHENFIHLLVSMITLLSYSAQVSIILNERQFIELYFVGIVSAPMFFRIVNLITGHKECRINGPSAGLYALKGLLYAYPFAYEITDTEKNIRMLVDMLTVYLTCIYFGPTGYIFNVGGFLSGVLMKRKFGFR